MTSKIQEEINKEHEKFNKKIKPLMDKRKEEERINLINVLSKHKGIIYKKNYGKDYCIIKVLKSLTKKGRLKYTKITIEEAEDYSIYYIKENKKILKQEAINLVKTALNKKE